MEEPIYCANCEKIFDEDDEVISVGDNFLTIKYFDSIEDNIFCSPECLMESLSVIYSNVSDVREML